MNNDFWKMVYAIDWQIVTALFIILSALGTIFAGGVALYLGLQAIRREEQRKSERHKQHVKLFKKELQIIKEDFKKILEIYKDSERVFIESGVLLQTYIFDIISKWEEAMPNFKEENIVDIVKAYEYVYILKKIRDRRKAELTTPEKRELWGTTASEVPKISIKRELFLDIANKVDDGINALEREGS